LRTPQDLANWAARKYDVSFRVSAGLKDSGEFEVFTYPLKPPTEAEALEAMDAVVAWVAAWSRPQGPGVDVERVLRQWPTLGRQSLPNRVVVSGFSTLAAVAGRAQHWHSLTANAKRLRELGDGVAGAVPSVALRLAGLDGGDVGRLIGAVRWLAANPESELLVREVPVPGADTKWLEGHIGMVKPLVQALTGRADLGLRKDTRRFRVRILDEAIPFGGRDVTMSAGEWAQRDVPARIVIVTENQQSLLRLEPMPGAVGVHGRGLDVIELANVKWIKGARVLYWGDLDSHGFNILGLVRRQWPQTESVLMDVDTLNRYWVCGVPEADPFRGDVGYLTASEREALALLRQHDWRLEQEQIPWEAARQAIRVAARPKKVEDVESLFGLLRGVQVDDIKVGKAERLAAKHEGAS